MQGRGGVSQLTHTIYRNFFGAWPPPFTPEVKRSRWLGIGLESRASTRSCTRRPVQRRPMFWTIVRASPMSSCRIHTTAPQPASDGPTGPEPQRTQAPFFPEKSLSRNTGMGGVERGTSQHKDHANEHSLVNNAATLAWLAQTAALEIHVPQWRFKHDA